MKKHLLNLFLSLLTIFLSFHIFAADTNSKISTRDTLLTVVLDYSDKTGKNIVISGELSKAIFSKDSEGYLLEDIVMTQINNWLLWHTPAEDIVKVETYAALNILLIEKHLVAINNNERLSVGYSGSDETQIADSYNDKCGLSFNVAYSHLHNRKIWAMPANEQPLKEVCLDFGLFLAVNRVLLKEINGQIVRETF